MRSESRPHALNAPRVSTSSSRRGEHFLHAPSRHWLRTKMRSAPSPVIVMASSPSCPYDVGEMRSESWPHALNASRVSTSSPRQGEHFQSRAFQTLISHVDVLSVVALNRDGVIASLSLRRRGDEIRVTAALNASRVSTSSPRRGRALPRRLPDTDFARRCPTHRCP